MYSAIFKTDFWLLLAARCRAQNVKAITFVHKQSKFFVLCNGVLDPASNKFIAFSILQKISGTFKKKR